MPGVVWKGFVTFGLVSFPVRLQPAARNKPLRFHLLHKKDLSRVKEVYYCASEDKPLQRDDLVKGYEVAKDEFVVVDQEELDKVAPKTAKVMDIVQFVKEDDFDPVYLDKSYHLVPDGDVTKPYALLREVMKKERRYAIAKVAMHNREHIVVLRPSATEMLAHTLFFADEVRRAEVKMPAQKFSDKEMALAGQLIETLESKFEPEKFQDEYQARVRELIERKQKGQTVRAPRQERTRPVVNILEALQKSLSQSQGAAHKPAARKTARGRGKSHRAA